MTRTAAETWLKARGLSCWQSATGRRWFIVTRYSNSFLDIVGQHHTFPGAVEAARSYLAREARTETAAARR